MSTQGGGGKGLSKCSSFMIHSFKTNALRVQRHMIKSSSLLWNNTRKLQHMYNMSFVLHKYTPALFLFVPKTGRKKQL